MRALGAVGGNDGTARKCARRARHLLPRCSAGTRASIGISQRSTVNSGSRAVTGTRGLLLLLWLRLRAATINNSSNKGLLHLTVYLLLIN